MASSVNQALWLSSYTEPLSLKDLPIPAAAVGSVVVRVLAAPIVPYAGLVHSGKIPGLDLELPLVPNPNAVGRIYAVGPDAVMVKPGDLVYVDSTVRARDDPNVVIMSGHLNGAGAEGKKLMQGEWRDGSFQQYLKVPLENVHILDDQRLIEELGYSPAVLQSIAHYSVAGGAIMEVADVKVAETVVVGPSGGSFGGLAVEMALALGANVIALGRYEEKLAKMKKILGHPRLDYVVMTGDDDADAEAILRATPNGAGADVYSDWTPAGLEKAPYLAAAVRTLKRGGRVVLSGGSLGHVEIPYTLMLLKDLKVTGKLMCSRETLCRLIRMVERGQLKIGVESGTEVSVFTLDQHVKAIEHAAEHGGWRNYTVMAPNP
ncbi:alcohol dehydrogenase [Fusarium oxysporum f. sp. raphani]|uniref:Alcohol dehydrogenase n=1 Tax=Fusarium oxysporum f. sp. raphani TaxID=96318 RepID=A0A8J5PNG8_FUSOX|nr:alcohol dehydrogenase [Fusarium oxysporum f. sp. raphani]